MNSTSSTPQSGTSSTPQPATSSTPQPGTSTGIRARTPPVIYRNFSPPSSPERPPSIQHAIEDENGDYAMFDDNDAATVTTVFRSDSESETGPPDVVIEKEYPNPTPREVQERAHLENLAKKYEELIIRFTSMRSRIVRRFSFQVDAQRSGRTGPITQQRILQVLNLPMDQFAIELRERSYEIYRSLSRDRVV